MFGLLVLVALLAIAFAFLFILGGISCYLIDCQKRSEFRKNHIVPLTDEQWITLKKNIREQKIKELYWLL